MNRLTRFLLQSLQNIERAGNRLPHPTLLFFYLCLLVVLLSWLAGVSELRAVHPVSGDVIHSRSLISIDGLHWWLENAVTNFTGFAPVGTVLVAILGIGVAERSGLLGCVLRLLVLKAPTALLSYAVVFAGVLSSLAADAGYVVLIPLAGLLFHAAGRDPLTGIAAAFAGVSGGFSANLLIGPIDAIMAGLSSEATQLVNSEYEVTAAANYYILIASTVLVSLLGGWVTEHLVAPRLEGDVSASEQQPLRPEELKALKVVAWFSLGFIAVLLWGLLPTNGALRSTDGHVLNSPFISGIVVLIAVYGAIAGILYGRIEGSFRNASATVEAMEQSLGAMGGYLVLMFFAAQFVNAFSWTQLGAITAIQGAELLQSLNPGAITLMLGLVLLSATINLLIGSASAKWALLAPVFVPMFYLLGISPEATQMAYRIGDSCTNIITPLMPYFGVVVSFAQRYRQDTGVGTLMAMMLPYSIVFLLGWSLLLSVWIGFGWPLGPGAPVTVTVHATAQPFP